MPRSLRPALIILALLGIVMTSLRAYGQSQESFEGFMSGIRANAVKGEVLYQRRDGNFPLEPGFKLDEGDFIRTGADAYVELLLQPGNYLRIGGATEFQIFSDQHDKMRLKLNHGAISLEILSSDSLGSYYNRADQAFELIRVITPNGEVLISHPGIFRINAASGQTEVIVRDGEAVVNGRRVKKKRRAVASSASVTLTEIDSRIEDAFDVWGRERAATSVHANKSLKNESRWSNRRKGQETSVDLPEEQEKNSRSPLVVSAKPGAVNFVETGVEFSRPSTGWAPLTEKSQLESGNKLRTAAYSFAEITLLPDMYLRLDQASEMLFEQLSNDAISLKILRGSAILDVARFDRKEVPQITLAGPRISAVVAEYGNFRIDIDAIIVREGKLIFKERSVGGCRRITGEAIFDCDQKRIDNFDYWSEHRGEGELYNGRATVAMATYLARYRKLRFRNTGFWFQHPGQTSFTFVPFTSQRFRSPYGGSYSTVLAPRPNPVFRVDPGRNSSPSPKAQIERP